MNNIDSIFKKNELLRLSISAHEGSLMIHLCENSSSYISFYHFFSYQTLVFFMIWILHDWKVAIICDGKSCFKLNTLEYRVLNLSDGIEDLGGIQWEILGCLAVVWVITYGCIHTGIKSTGKVAYLTSTFPMVLLFTLMVRGLDAQLNIKNNWTENSCKEKNTVLVFSQLRSKQLRSIWLVQIRVFFSFCLYLWAHKLKNWSNRSFYHIFLYSEKTIPSNYNRLNIEENSNWDLSWFSHFKDKDFQAKNFSYFFTS